MIRAVLGLVDSRNRHGASYINETDRYEDTAQLGVPHQHPYGHTDDLLRIFQQNYYKANRRVRQQRHRQLMSIRSR
jgi:hypothetical protein